MRQRVRNPGLLIFLPIICLVFFIDLVSFQTSLRRLRTAFLDPTPRGSRFDGLRLCGVVYCSSRLSGVPSLTISETRSLSCSTRYFTSMSPLVLFKVFFLKPVFPHFQRSPLRVAIDSGSQFSRLSASDLARLRASLPWPKAFLPQAPPRRSLMQRSVFPTGDSETKT